MYTSIKAAQKRIPHLFAYVELCSKLLKRYDTNEVHAAEMRERIFGSFDDHQNVIKAALAEYGAITTSAKLMLVSEDILAAIDFALKKAGQDEQRIWEALAMALEVTVFEIDLDEYALKEIPRHETLVKKYRGKATSGDKELGLNLEFSGGNGLDSEDLID
jgi:hypothetical protein